MPRRGVWYCALIRTQDLVLMPFFFVLLLDAAGKCGRRGYRLVRVACDRCSHNVWVACKVPGCVCDAGW
jgi:hypothetical protein